MSTATVPGADGDRADDKGSARTAPSAVTAVRPWDAAWPWSRTWADRVPQDDEKCVRSLTLDWDDTLTVRNSGVYLHDELPCDIDTTAWDETSRRVAAHYHGQKVKDVVQLCGARDLFTHMLGGAARVAAIRDLLEWAYADNVRIRICSRNAVEEIMAGLAAVGLDPRLFYEIHAKRTYDCGPWLYWARRDNTGLLRPAFELAYDQQQEVSVRRAHDEAAGDGSDLGARDEEEEKTRKHTDVPPRDYTSKAEVLREIRAADAPSVSVALFADDSEYNCRDAKKAGYLVVRASCGGLTEREIADVRAILVAGCYPPEIAEFRARRRAVSGLARQKRAVALAEHRVQPPEDPALAEQRKLAQAERDAASLEEALRPTRLVALREVRLAMEERKRLKLQQSAPP